VTGKTYRLLSEAEYEYAARAGTTTRYPWGDAVKPNGAAMASCDGCGSKWDDVHPAPVGAFPPNKFGLYDMVGNVWEWTQDCAHPSYNGAPVDGSAWLQGNGGGCNERHLRAGSYLNAAAILGSAIRYWNTSGERNFTTGFRVARTLVGP
jgi:formylglycine-generating enzyme required for sulfatase activity